MESEALLTYFHEILRDDPSKSEAVAAIQTLLEYIKLDNAETLYGLTENIRGAIRTLTSSDHSGAVTCINSGCELFLRFITLAEVETQATSWEQDFQACKQILVDRGSVFLNKVASSRKKIRRIANPFINDGATILVHSRSRVILEVLQEATEAKKRFTVYVTEANPDKTGQTMCEELSAMGIPTVLILDSAVGYIMEKVDFVMVGAEGVVESGGIINKIGTFTIGVCAKHMNKPVYVLAESFKFARLFPLNQQDVPNQFKYKASMLSSDVDLSKEHPSVDYTPPALITLLFTDLGVLTPSAISDELIKLYL